MGQGCLDWDPSGGPVEILQTCQGMKQERTDTFNIALPWVFGMTGNNLLNGLL